MTTLSDLLLWLAGDWVILIFLEITIKCSLVAGVALLLSRIVAQRRPELAGLILRQSMLLALVIPLIIVFDAVFNGYRTASELSSWIVTLPIMVAGEAETSIAASQVSLPWTYQNVFLLLMMAVSLALTARVIIGSSLACRLVRNAGVNESKEISTIAVRAGRRADLDVVPIIRYSDSAMVPFAHGLLQHAVILPGLSKRWSATELEAVLIHEFSHIRRRDNTWAFLATLAAALHWINPLIWLARRQMLLQAERACDVGVVQAGIDPGQYAMLLVDLARSATGKRGLIIYTSQFLGMKLLEVRIMSILQSSFRSLQLTATARLIVVSLALASLLPLSVVRLSAADQSESKANSVSQNQSADYPAPDDFVAVDSMPVKLIDAPPVYPDSARRAGIEGSTWVKALVDTIGAVSSALVFKTSGNELLDQAAVESALKCKYQPALSNGQKVRIWIVYEVRFKLKQK